MKKKTLLKLLGIGLLAIPTAIAVTSCQAKGPKISPNSLCLQFNDFLSESKEKGEHEKMIDKWFSLGSEGKTIDYENLKNINGNIRVGVVDGIEPFTYMQNNKYTGLIVDMVTKFADQYDYSVTFQSYNGVGALIAAVTSNNCDLGASSITITEERSEAVLFSDPYMIDDSAFMFKKTNAAMYTGLSSFEGKTIGVASGSLFGQMLEERLSAVTINEYASTAELCLAVETGMIDAALSDESTFKFAILSHPELTILKQHLYDNPLGLFFNKTTYSSFKELSGKTIGVFEGEPYQETLKGLIENPSFKIYQYTQEEDIYNDLKSGKIDGATIYTDIARYKTGIELKGMGLLQEPIATIRDSVVFPKSEKGTVILDRLNEFIQKEENKYLFNSIKRNWINRLTKDERDVPDYPSLAATNGVLKIGLNGAEPPYAESRNGVFEGIQIDYMSIFAKEYGYALEFHNCLSKDVKQLFEDGEINAYIDNGLLPEKGDYFMRSETIGTCDINLLVRDSYVAKMGFFQTLATNFKKTFIVEDRYKTFLSGVGVTLLIAISSIVLGLILGFGIYILLRTNSKVAKGIYRVIEFIVSGTPAVVFLMIFYYIIFGGSQISSTIVAIIAFSFIFMCNTVTMLKTGFGAIDIGQSEAAFTLGYSRSRAFTKILLPQAAKTFMPLLKGNVIEHIKATAIVGYVAIIDLTKATEIIRSRTFDAFFSLIVTTLLYFAIEYLFILILKFIPVDPKKRKKIAIMKGVQTND